MIPSVRRVTGANREPIKPRLPIENTSKVEFDGRKASGHVTANIGTPLMVPSVPCGTGSNRYPVAVKPRVPIENTPKVECAGPTVSGGVETSLSIRLKHGPDSMTSRCDAAVAQRNAALATQRVKLEPSRWWQDRKRATVQSSRGRPRSQAATKPAYIDKYRPAGKTRTKHHIDSYCLSDSSRAGSSARLPPALGSSGTNAKRTRFEMEDQPKDARSSSSEPSKRPKTTETKPLDQMKTLKQVEAALCAINGKLKNIGKTYPMTSVVREAERLIKQHKLVRLRRDELDEKNKKDKMVNYLAYKSLLWSSPNSIKVAPKGSKRSNHDIATETKKSDYAPKVPSSADNAELSDGVGQFATMTQKNAGRGTAYPGKSTGRVNAPGLAHALVGNAEQLMKTTTDVRRNTLGMEHATPKTVPRSTTENETAAAIDSLIASGKAAAQSLCAYPKVEHQPSSKRRRATAAELNDEVYPRYRMDWDDEDVEMSLP